MTTPIKAIPVKFLVGAAIMVHLGIGFMAVLYSGSFAVQALIGIPLIFAAGLETGMVIVAFGREWGGAS